MTTQNNITNETIVDRSRRDPEIAVHAAIAKAAFKSAILAGGLSRDPWRKNYAGNYMYMHSTDRYDHFKNIITRRYLQVERS